MIYKVKIENREYLVEIGDITSRPIIAMVDDTRIEVWPHESRSGLEQSTAPEEKALDHPDVRSITAPMPGTIVSIAVKSGTAVSVGQLICTLEAMKMQNPIRSPRAGVIASVHVSVGQTVSYQDSLVDFEP